LAFVASGGRRSCARLGSAGASPSLAFDGRLVGARCLFGKGWLPDELTCSFIIGRWGRESTYGDGKLIGFVVKSVLIGAD